MEVDNYIIIRFWLKIYFILFGPYQHVESSTHLIFIYLLLGKRDFTSHLKPIFAVQLSNLWLWLDHFKIEFSFGNGQWRQTRCCRCSTCYTTFPAPPRNYVYKHAPHFCPAPNLFSMCTTGFKPRLAPLDIFKKFERKADNHSTLVYIYS